MEVFLEYHKAARPAFNLHANHFPCLHRHESWDTADRLISSRTSIHRVHVKQLIKHEYIRPIGFVLRPATRQERKQNHKSVRPSTAFLTLRAPAVLAVYRMPRACILQPQQRLVFPNRTRTV